MVLKRRYRIEMEAPSYSQLFSQEGLLPESLMLLRLCVIIHALLSNLKVRISLLLLALLSEVLLSHPTSQQETEQSLHTYSDYWDIGRND